MKLLTKELEKKIPALYSCDETPVMKIVAHYFSPWYNWDWYVVEGNWQEGTYVFFGFVKGLENEWGYFTLNEFEEVNTKAGFQKIERDLYWTEVYTFVGAPKFYESKEEAQRVYEALNPSE